VLARCSSNPDSVRTLVKLEYAPRVGMEELRAHLIRQVKRAGLLGTRHERQVGKDSI